jgi:hypothetical protein
VALSNHISYVLKNLLVAFKIGRESAPSEKRFKRFMDTFAVRSCFRWRRLKSLKDSDLLISSTAALEVFDGGMGVWHFEFRI